MPAPGSFVARISAEDTAGHKNVRWVPLAAKSAAEAQDEFRKLLVELTENRLRPVGRSPAFAEYLDETYLPLLAGSGKKPDTLTTEQAHYNRWREPSGICGSTKSALVPFGVPAFCFNPFLDVSPGFTHGSER